MQKAWSLLWVLSVCLFTGCGTTQNQSERNRQILALHPAREMRMSTRPENGYVPSGVWKIQGARNTVYLAGTCHVVSSNDIPFPSPFYAAYHDAQEIYIESDLQPSWFGQMRLAFKMVKWMKPHVRQFACPPGQTLQNYLPTNTIERLKTFYGKAYAKRERMTPLFLVFLNGMESFAGQYNEYSGVDDTFALLARKDRKPIHTLDDRSVETLVLLVLDEMLLDVSRDILKHGADAVVREEILGDPPESEAADETEVDWRRGDLAAIEQEQVKMQQEAPDLYQKLLPERNRKWLPKLKTALKSKHNILVLVGSMHLAGKEGLLQMLQDAGYPIEQMHGVDQAISKSSTSCP